MSVSNAHRSLLVEITDDGIRGADPLAGSGLGGLADRVEALGGWLSVCRPGEHGDRGDDPVLRRRAVVITRGAPCAASVRIAATTNERAPMARSTSSPAVTIAALAFMAVAWPGAAQAHRATVVGPGDSIQAAVDAANPGDIIRVFGEHRENVVIQKDGLTLHGVGAVVLPPATPAANACFDPTVPGETVKGICVSGDIDFDTGEVSGVVSNVTVSGFTVRDFTGAGIGAVAARDTTLKGNVATNNGEGGIAAIVSTGTRMLFNRASGGDAAAFSVVLSPAADATLFANAAQDSRFGILINDARYGRIVANSVHDNCVGVLIAAAPGAAGDFRIAANHIHRNTRSCPANADFPALSGAGVALFGATGNAIVSNLITGNAPTGETLATGGVAVIEGSTPPTGNVVMGNRILHNDPDLFWDQTGTGNVFRDNLCRTSTPATLCR